MQMAEIERRVRLARQHTDEPLVVRIGADLLAELVRVRRHDGPAAIDATWIEGTPGECTVTPWSRLSECERHLAQQHPIAPPQPASGKPAAEVGLPPGFSGRASTSRPSRRLPLSLARAGLRKA